MFGGGWAGSKSANGLCSSCVKTTRLLGALSQQSSLRGSPLRRLQYPVLDNKRLWFARDQALPDRHVPVKMITAVRARQLPGPEADRQWLVAIIGGDIDAHAVRAGRHLDIGDFLDLGLGLKPRRDVVALSDDQLLRIDIFIGDINPSFIQVGLIEIIE